jgi:hypothetical protein
MARTQSQQEIWRAIEEDLAEDRALLRQVEHELHDLERERGPSQRRRVGWLITASMVVVAAGSFAAGWFLGPAEEAAPAIESVAITYPIGWENPSVLAQDLPGYPTTSYVGLENPNALPGDLAAIG